MTVIFVVNLDPEMSMNISMTDFALGRHFDPEFAGTKILNMTPEDFLYAVNRMASYLNGEGTHDALVKLDDGYAPFCKHLITQNFAGAMCGVTEITAKNEGLLKSDYKAREGREDRELAVLSRWFENLETTRAPYLDIILYSAEQLEKEGSPVEGEWGIVSINAEILPAESPLKPITMMRNSLGKDEGGSGVHLDREKYLQAVEYWKKHANIK